MGDNSLSIAIVGAGLAGLLAALRLCQDGHSVKVFERRKTLSQQGGGLIIRPNATRHLIRWGLKEDFESATLDLASGEIRDLVSGKVLQYTPGDQYSEFPTWGLVRQDMQQLLFKKVTAMKAVEMHFGIEITGLSDDLFSLRPSLTLRDGEVIRVDLIIVADGVRSRLRDQVLADCFDQKSEKVKPSISSLTTYQTQRLFKDVKHHEYIKELFPTPLTIVWRGQDRHAVMGGGSEKVDVVIGDFITDEGSNVVVNADDAKLWEETGDISYVRSLYKGTHPYIETWLSETKSCSRWRLSELPNLPRWTSRHGRVVLLGDAAHAMLPSSAQGISQIVEDIAVLSDLISRLRDMPGTGRKRVEPKTRLENRLDLLPLVTATWQDVRKPRVERAKEFSRASQAMYQSKPKEQSDVAKDLRRSQEDVNKDASEPKSGHENSTVGADMHADLMSDQFQKWLLDCDVCEGLDSIWQERLGTNTQWSPDEYDV